MTFQTSSQWRCCIPVLNARRSARFYCDILGFRENWVHQFGDGFPLYIPGGTVMDKISGFYGIQPGEYLEYLPDEDGD